VKKKGVSLTPVSENPSTPLLPLTVNTTAANGRAVSPNPAFEDARIPTPKMWAGNPNLHTPAPPHMSGIAGPSSAHTPVRDTRDLTNTKLAKNQYVLLEQIESLRRTVDKQGEMLATLMQALALKEGLDLPVKQDKGKGKEKSNDDEQGPSDWE